MRAINQQSFSEVGLDLMAQAVKRQYSKNSQFDLAVLLLLGGGGGGSVEGSSSIHLLSLYFINPTQSWRWGEAMFITSASA